MAFTAENKADAYLFFTLAFNAAPGSVYGGQIVQAYEAGMTTSQIVNEYTTKEQFTKLYPTTQSNAEFAAALVKNVVGNTASVTVKAQAEADIVAAMAAGLSKGDVIVNILGNLSKMDVTNADWGTTVALINNKIAVAKALTEGDKALNTTDVSILQSPLKTVTQDPATVLTAIKGAGDLAAKLDNLLSANKAKADFAAVLDLDGNGSPDGLDSTTVNTAVTTDVNAKAGAVTALVTGWAAGNNAAANKTAVDAVKATNAAAVTLAEAQVEVKQAEAKVAGVTDKQIAQAAALEAAVKTAADNVAVAAAEQNVAYAQLKASVPAADQGAFPTVNPVTGELAGYIKANVTTGKLQLDTTATTKVTDGNKALVSALVAKAQANLDAAAVKTTADNAKTAFFAALDQAPATDKADAIDAINTAQAALKAAQLKNPAIDKALAAFNASKATSDQLGTLDKAIADAQQAFKDGGFDVPVEATGALLAATAGDDTYYTVGGTATISGFGLLGKDSIYVGKGYELNTTGDLTKGDDTKLEVFFKANGASTDVYVEQKAFGSHDAGAVAGNANITKVMLTGVSADKLVLKDGFITVSA